MTLPRDTETRALVEDAGPKRLADALVGIGSLASSTDASRLCEAFVVVVSTPQDRHVRRVYLSLHSAQKALQRSQDAGKPAHLILCRLTPAQREVA